MPAILNWFLRLVFTNPICMRLVQGGSRRTRHLFIRSGYLALVIFVLLFAMIPLGAVSMSVRELATRGAQIFTWIAYLQVGLICLLTPVFMAGAISQEANPRTWDILLTTPLGNMQIVLGNLFGRLFFILALLGSTLPLFAVTQYFGGVPGESIFASYAIAGSSSLLVAAIAITLCVNRTAGRRAVFWFYVSVVMYLFATYAADLPLRQSAGPAADYTTVLTPLNPFLALEVMLKSNTYVIRDLTGEGASWLTRVWMGRPIATFCWLCIILSVVLILYSTLRVRQIGARTGSVPWFRRLLGLGAKNAIERPARHVGLSPISWRESVARGKTPVAILARWGFVALGIALGVAVLALYHVGTWTVAQFHVALVAVLAAEIVVITLVAINLSATAVSREREDGTLDLILTTPIQPGPYLLGKLRGLIQYLLPLIIVPVVTLALAALYVLTNGLGNGGVEVTTAVRTATMNLPLVLPEGAITLPLVLIPFVALCVMVGLHWSIKSKGTIGAVIGAVFVAGAAAGVLGLCAVPAGREMPVIGPVFTAMNPVNLVFAIVYPGTTLQDALASGEGETRVAMVIGALIAVGAYSAGVYGALTAMKRSFMMTVRKLAGTN